MLKRALVDRRILYAFMFMMLAMNAAVFLTSWKDIMGGNNDFPVFYSSAQMMREGQASRLYDIDVENSFVHRVSDLARAPNNHLPYELFIFIPFTYLNYSSAHLMWTALSLGLLGCVALLMHNIHPGGLGLGSILLATLAFFPVWYCLLQGQDSILLVLLFALSYCLWKRGQDDAAGFVLAMGLFRPQLVLPFVLVTFLAGKWRFVRGFLPGAVLVSMFSIWVVGINGMTDYARVLISQGSQGSASALAERWQVHLGLMPTLRGLLWLALPPSVPASVRSFLLICGTLGGLLWAAKGLRDAMDGVAFDAAFATAVAVVMVVSFHSLPHDFSLMILPLLVAMWVVTPSDVRAERNSYALVTIGFLLFFTPLYFVLIFTGWIGLFVLPVVAFVWLMNRWESAERLAPPATHRSARPISLPTP